MKKKIFVILFGIMIPIVSMAQNDDLYFSKEELSSSVPTTKQTKSGDVREANNEDFHSRYQNIGSTRDVDEYNRRSSVTSADSTGLVEGDSVVFDGQGAYPDADSSVSAESEDVYENSRNIARFGDGTVVVYSSEPYLLSFRGQL